MSAIGGVPIYKAKWLENIVGRGVQSYFTSGQNPFPPQVKYLIYPIRHTGYGTGIGGFSCGPVTILNPNQAGGVPDAVGSNLDVIPYTPATNSNGTPLTPPSTTIPTDDDNYWTATLVVDQSTGVATATNYTLYENPNKVYAYIIKAYDSDQISSPVSMTGCVSQVVVYGKIYGGPATTSNISFQNTTVFVNWNVNLQGFPLTNTYVETLTLPVRYFDGVFLLPQYI